VKDWFATENVRRIATPVYPAENAWKKRTTGAAQARSGARRA
jgi:hypothetical protein